MTIVLTSPALSVSLTYSSTSAKYFLFIRRKTCCSSVVLHVRFHNKYNAHCVMLAWICITAHMQKIHARRKPVMQTLQQDQVPQRQQWRTNYDEASATELFTVADFRRIAIKSNVDQTLNSPLRKQLSLVKIIKHHFSVNYMTF